MYPLAARHNHFSAPNVSASFFFGCGMAAPSSQRSLRFNSFIESMIGCTTHVFAGRRAQSFFCPNVSASFLFWLRLGRARISLFQSFR
jgi:hypothetical protein